jgi:hypothetical protein
MQPPNPIEKIGEGVTREWLFERQIVVYTLYDIRRASVDAWTNAVRDVIDQWSPDQPYLSLQDASRLVTLSPYARNRSKETAEFALQRGLHGRSAVVLANNLLSQVIRMFVQHDLSTGTLHRSAFLDKEAGLQWLIEGLSLQK